MKKPKKKLNCIFFENNSLKIVDLNNIKDIKDIKYINDTKDTIHLIDYKSFYSNSYLHNNYEIFLVYSKKKIYNYIKKFIKKAELQSNNMVLDYKDLEIKRELLKNKLYSYNKYINFKQIIDIIKKEIPEYNDSVFYELFGICDYDFILFEYDYKITIKDWINEL